MMAGFDTSSHTIAWCLYALATNPAVQDKVERELQRAGLLGENGDLSAAESLCMEDLSDLRYLNCVIDEAMRMFPVAATASVREVAEPTRVGKYVIPRGVIVWPMLYTLHNSTFNWEHPELFKPERWAEKHGYVPARANEQPSSPTTSSKPDDSASSSHPEGSQAAEQAGSSGHRWASKNGDQAAAAGSAQPQSDPGAGGSAPPRDALCPAGPLAAEPAPAGTAPEEGGARAPGRASLAASSSQPLGAGVGPAAGIPGSTPTIPSSNGSMRAESMRVQQVESSSKGNEAPSGGGNGGGSSSKRFIPFSDGMKNCLGQSLGLMEVRSVLVVLLSRFRVELDPSMGGSETVRSNMIMSLTLKIKGGLRVSLTPRGG
mmetsp:Transcript_38956/g.86652  ORF Transcript_38956/g.86652 Transcript_38956/m.86652 type:complete len:374 (+) Transcript_38956:2712-3833(+)